MIPLLFPNDEYDNPVIAFDNIILKSKYAKIDLIKALYDGYSLT